MRHSQNYITLLCILFLFSLPLAQPGSTLSSPPTDTADQELIWDTTEVDDTVAIAEAQEDDFQSALDSLFDSTLNALDTAGWDTAHINAGRFNSATWTDSAIIVLSDSAKNKRYVHPCPGVVTSNFGQRRYLWHYGVDTRLRKGDSVAVSLDGIVRVLQYDRRGYGHVVVVRHADGLETIYGHLSKILVSTRQKVTAGEIIGLGGNTGRSTGAHLHFEIRYRGEPFNPNDIVDFKNERLKSDTLRLTRANFNYLLDIRSQKWVKIRKGDNLGIIARRHHTTIAKLCKLNRITRKTTLRIGRKIRYQ